MESRNPKRKSRSIQLQKQRQNIGRFCASDFCCGCAQACHNQFTFQSYENNYKHKEMLSQKEYIAAMLSTISAALVFDVESGKRLVPTQGTPFKFCDKPVCLVTLRNLWAMPESSYYRYLKRVLEEGSSLPNTRVFQEPSKPTPDDTWQYEAFKDWAVCNLLKGLAQEMPTDGSKQITPIDFALEYSLYKERMPHPDALVNEAKFRKYCLDLFAERGITVRKKVEVSGLCSTCDGFDARTKELRRSDPDPVAWEELNTLKVAHSKTHKFMRDQYDERRREGADPNGTVDSIALDGAANKNTIVPHAPHAVKHLNEKKQHFFAMHLQLTILHGYMLLFSLAFPWSGAKGANMMLTTLWNLLRLVASGHAGERYFRKELHLQVDGGSENWNRNVFGFCALLVHYRIYQVVVLHRLMVGHTHNDVDGWFGLMKMWIFGKDATKSGRWLITLREYISWIISWPVRMYLKQVHVQGSQLDFKTWLEPHVNWKLTGYCGLVRDKHYFHWEMDQHGVVRMKYKGATTSPSSFPKELTKT